MFKKLTILLMALLATQTFATTISDCSLACATKVTAENASPKNQTYVDETQTAIDNISNCNCNTECSQTWCKAYDALKATGSATTQQLEDSQAVAEVYGCTCGSELVKFGFGMILAVYGYFAM